VEVLVEPLVKRRLWMDQTLYFRLLHLLAAVKEDQMQGVVRQLGGLEDLVVVRLDMERQVVLAQQTKDMLVEVEAIKHLILVLVAVVVLVQLEPMELLL
jgi:hypothetical protein